MDTKIVMSNHSPSPRSPRPPTPILLLPNPRKVRKSDL